MKSNHLKTSSLTATLHHMRHNVDSFGRSRIFLGGKRPTRRGAPGSGCRAERTGQRIIRGIFPCVCFSPDDVRWDMPGGPPSGVPGVRRVRCSGCRAERTGQRIIGGCLPLGTGTRPCGERTRQAGRRPDPADMCPCLRLRLPEHMVRHLTPFPYDSPDGANASIPYRGTRHANQGVPGCCYRSPAFICVCSCQRLFPVLGSRTPARRVGLAYHQVLRVWRDRLGQEINNV